MRGTYLAEHCGLVHVALETFQEPTVVLQENAVLATAATRRRLWNAGIHVCPGAVRPTSGARTSVGRRASRGPKRCGRKREEEGEGAEEQSMHMHMVPGAGLLLLRAHLGTIPAASRCWPRRVQPPRFATACPPTGQLHAAILSTYNDVFLCIVWPYQHRCEGPSLSVPVAVDAPVRRHVDNGARAHRG